MKKKGFMILSLALCFLAICAFTMKATSAEQIGEKDYVKYVKVNLTSDRINELQPWEKRMIPLLIEAAKIMDDIFWMQAFPGNKDSLLASARSDAERQYLMINYGPWDRLNGNKPFKDGYGEKPKGAGFYPQNLSQDEFEMADLPDKQSLYTLLKRNEEEKLYTVPYYLEYKPFVSKAAVLLKEAAAICQDVQLKEYLVARAEAMLTDKYQQSDIAWLKLRSNTLDIIIGPIETYEDKLFGYKAAHESYVLIKDMDWSARLDKIATYLPDLQEALPVSEEFKQESPGSNSQLAVYDVIYYAGDCNAGSKTIAVNLPNDEDLQLSMGTRRSQLKNVMKAKFDKILLPIANELIVPEQRQNVKFEAFFANTMFHEVAHGLGVKNTINDKGTVRMALKEHASALEEGKADILGLFMVTNLYQEGKYQQEGVSVMDYYVTFMASIFRSVRFGAASAHGKANMIRFNYFLEKEAFTRDPKTGRYRVNEAKMTQAVNDLSAEILTIQGNGDYDQADHWVNQKGVIREQLKADLDRLEAAGIPVDVVFIQGVGELGL